MGSLDSCDPVLLELFRSEVETHLPALSQGLLALEKGKAGPKDLEAMMRAAHLIKGAARIVGVEAAVRVAHGMEDCFSAAQGQRLTLNSEAVDVLLRGLDALQLVCSPQPDTVMSDPSLETLLDEIVTVRDGKLSKPLPPAVPKSAEASTEVAVVTPFRGPARETEVVRGEGDSTRSAAQSQVSRVVLPEELDDVAARTVRIELCDRLRQEPARLCVDFSQVQHMSAMALSVLASFSREIARSQALLAVDAEGVSPRIATLLRTSGLDQTFRPLSESKSHDE